MRIAFFSDNFYPELSGITDTIITTGKELKSRGHEVLYVGPYYTPREYELANRQHPATPADDIIDDMPILRLPSVHIPASPTGQSRFAFPAMGRIMPRLQEFKPDVIHTQSPYGTGRAALKAARRLGVPIVGTNHTAVEDFFPPGTQAVMRRFDARYYNHCAFVTAPYGKLLERMREVGFARPGQAVANPAVLSEFTPTTAKERAEHKTALGLSGGPVLLYAGRLGVEKRVDVILRALPALIKEFPDLTFVATGRGAAQPGLERLVQKLCLGRHVRFTGFLARKALPHIYKAADAFVMMSTSDSQSIALMQAYATGIPAVCADARGLPDYTPSDVGFLVKAGDHDALAQRMGLLLRDDALRLAMGQAALEYAKNFAPEKIAAEWEQIYADALKK